MLSISYEKDVYKLVNRKKHNPNVLSCRVVAVEGFRKNAAKYRTICRELWEIWFKEVFLALMGSMMKCESILIIRWGGVYFDGKE